MRAQSGRPEHLLTSRLGDRQFVLWSHVELGLRRAESALLGWTCGEEVGEVEHFTGLEIGEELMNLVGAQRHPALRFRVRRHGEREAWPVLVAQMRGRAPSGEALGLVVQVQPAPGYPDLLTGVHASDTITATTVTSVEVQVPLVATALGRYAVDVDTPAESGTVDELVAYLGVWCTSNSSGTKALVGNISLYLAQP
mgnify:CR=1 FL=1